MLNRLRNPVEATSVGTETILLVEDEAAVRDVTGAYLESKGYTVLEASNAKEALNIGKSHQWPIHVLITDIVMPGLGGLELAKFALGIVATACRCHLCPDTQTAC